MKTVVSIQLVSGVTLAASVLGQSLTRRSELAHCPGKENNLVGVVCAKRSCLINVKMCHQRILLVRIIGQFNITAKIAIRT